MPNRENPSSSVPRDIEGTLTRQVGVKVPFKRAGVGRETPRDAQPRPDTLPGGGL
jgi:hypothetical protein